MEGEELQRLIVRLVGDATEYRKMLTEAQAATQKAAEEVAQAATKIERFQQKLEGIANTARQLLVAFGGTALLREALGNFQEAEQISLELTATLEANGREVESTRTRYEAFAAQLEKTTVAEDDAVISLLTMAETYRLTGDEAETATKNAIALAKGNTAQAQTYLRLTAALARGDVETAMHMSRMVPQLRGIKDETEFVSEAEKLFTLGMKQAEAAMQSSSGQLQVLKRDYGNLLEEFGEVIAQGLSPLIRGMTQLVGVMKGLPPEVRIGIVTIIALTSALAAAGPVITNMIATLGALKTAALGTWAVLAANPLLAIAVAATAAIAAAVLLARHLQAATGEAEKLNKELRDMERAGQIVSGQQIKDLQEQNDLIKRQAEAIQDPAERQEFLAKKITESTEAAKEFEHEVNRSRLAVAEADAQRNFFARGIDTIIGRDPLANMTERVKRDEAVLKALAGQHDALMRLRTRAAQPRTDPKLLEDADKLINKLKDQASALGAVGEAADIAALKRRKAPAELIAEAEAWQYLNDELKRGKKVAEEQSKAVAEIKDKFGDPFDKFTTRVEQLNTLLDQGKITEAEYGRAMGDAEKKLDEAGDAAKKAKEEIQKLDAAMSGSVEARTRQAEFFANVRAGFETTRSRFPNVPEGPPRTFDTEGFGPLPAARVITGGLGDLGTSGSGFNRLAGAEDYTADAALARLEMIKKELRGFWQQVGPFGQPQPAGVPGGPPVQPARSPDEMVKIWEEIRDLLRDSKDERIVALPADFANETW